MRRALFTIGAAVLFIAGAAAAATVSGAGPLQVVTTTTVQTTTAIDTTTPVTTPRRRVPVCHHTRSRKNPHRTIVVSESGARAHARHGDSPGPCTSAANLRRHSTSAHVRRFHKNTTLRAEVRREKRRGR